MAFGKGNQSTEAGVRKLYTGIGSFYVKGINLNKKELGEVFGSERDEEPSYLGERDVNGVKYPQVRIDVVIATEPKDCGGIEKTFIMPFFITKRNVVGSNSGKIQVIDIYGRTQWVTQQQLANHEIPTSEKTGLPLNIDADYRPLYDGEEALTLFLKNYLNIPSVEKWKDRQVVGLIDNPSDAEARLQCIEDYFKGDFSELKEIATYQPNNKFKVMLGVRTTDDNKQYQAFFTEMTLKNSISDYSKLSARLADRKNAGAYGTTDFEVAELHEYENTPSEIPAASAHTTGTAAPNPWFKK